MTTTTIGPTPPTVADVDQAGAQTIEAIKHGTVADVEIAATIEHGVISAYCHMSGPPSDLDTSTPEADAELEAEL